MNGRHAHSGGIEVLAAALGLLLLFALLLR